MTTTGDMLLITFLTVITGINFYIHTLTTKKYNEIMLRLWNWESYIRRWLKNELKSRPPQD